MGGGPEGVCVLESVASYSEGVGVISPDIVLDAELPGCRWLGPLNQFG